ncbi:MAG TPA: TIGR04222 domain-containing membrane protein [Xanthomonadaceae bacterium]|jgi:uncharacterized protein (TIGR04222 family)|nr:TIGR04222 domain-containing membrane protein [Xanthomonadaceae bacterium]
MNPFDLHGFAFLFFYLLAGIGTLWGLRAWIRFLERGDGTSRQDMSDPYLIAYLRAGHNEALRVATVALIDRGLLDAKDQTLSTRNADAVELVQRPIEKAILKRYLTPGKAFEIFKDEAAIGSCTAYRRLLEDKRMIADGSTYVKRLPWVLIAIGLLIMITLVKVDMALSQGRHNVGFLIVLTLVFAFSVFVIWGKRRTASGDATLADLRALFARLKDRAGALRAGGETNEAALLTAVFGLAALPTMMFPFTRNLYPSGSTNGSSCGASGSSCGSSSCGGGCGGGGCGG